MSSSTVSVPLSTLNGVIERITFHSEESGYTVARLNTGNVKQLITIVDSFANIQAGQKLQLQGVWGEHAQYGSQFQVVQYKESDFSYTDASRTDVGF
jgi:exodeoxyribonuclease V alpha subunit